MISILCHAALGDQGKLGRRDIAGNLVGVIELNFTNENTALTKQEQLRP
jgi:hypothetical protein